MAIITPFRERKKLRYLLFVLGIALVGTIFFVWWGFFAKPTPLPPPPPPPPEIKINFEVLESPILKEFQPFEEIPPFEEEIGRENPFLPY